SWEGQSFTGFEGDSVASALFANGVKIFSRSLKYHRPRGLYSMDGESANTMVNINGECNARSETTLLSQGDRVTAQNYWGSVENDRFAFLNYFDGFMPAGFYYRRLHKPAFLWSMASKFIRKMAGTGVLDTKQTWNKNNSGELYPQADVCVIGGGPAGLKAAIASAGKGLRVILLEGRTCLGGNYDWRVREYNGESLFTRAETLLKEVENNKNIRVFKKTSLIDLSGNNQVTAFQTGSGAESDEQRYIHIRPESVVVATGVMERPLIFEQNELPGIMQVGCAWRLARSYGILPGKKAVFCVGDDLGLEAALDLAQSGLEIKAVADQRDQGYDIELVEAIMKKGILFLKNYIADSAIGKKHVTGVTLSSMNGKDKQKFECDLLVASAGLTPLTGPLNTVGAKMKFDEHTGFFLPERTPFGVHAAGRILGYHTPDAIEAHGTLAGLKAARDAGADVSFTAAENTLKDLCGPARGNNVAFSPNIGVGRKSFVCFDEDGTVKSVKQSIDQGFDKPELVKRFGGFGLGPGQGGVPGHNLPLVISQLENDPNSSITPTNIRSPLVPVLMATVAGQNHLLKRYTPMVDQQKSPQTEFIRTGAWMRANRFSDDPDCVEEVTAVRKNAGMIDVSTLGKFRIFGPDALKALQRVYISDMSQVTSGKLKYSAMLNTSGAVLDDGVVTKMADNDYYLTTSSAWAAEAESWIRYHTRYADLDFHIVNLSNTLAAINIAGPKSRQILQKLTENDVSNNNFPYMGYKDILLKDMVMAKTLRVGFLGELSYEIHFPASYGPAVWDKLLKAGKEFGLMPIGLEAQNISRMEKGHVIIGLETEQNTNLRDLSLGFLWDQKDAENQKVGAPALKFSQGQKGRTKLVGLEITDGQDCPGDGAIIYQDNTIVGHVCTVRKSITLNKILAMALVKDPLNKIGNTIHIYQNEGQGEKRFTAKVVPMPFYDPKGLRLKDKGEK
ncbi:MAG: (2Fe-2S)-binding protein, partial [Desulfobacula sp.]|uniref:2Fe-2S iron-sulfur cluster-binding protein n=1 Tax=Desulfobacula sp. TaxID=2593537 RepID=UPI0025C64B76